MSEIIEEQARAIYETLAYSTPWEYASSEEKAPAVRCAEAAWAVLQKGSLEVLAAMEPAAPLRCAECDCENGGDDCNWIVSKPAAPTVTLTRALEVIMANCKFDRETQRILRETLICERARGVLAGSETEGDG